MAITIAANLSKKIPIPGADFSSQSASITITAEVSDLTQVAAEAQKLYRIAESAVDAQLHGTAVPVAPASPNSTNLLPVGLTTHPAPRHQTAQPYRGSGQRRAPAPATDSQLRFLDRLITQTGTSTDAICSAHRVGSLADLSCKEAAGVIDELKSQGIAA